MKEIPAAPRQESLRAGRNGTPDVPAWPDLGLSTLAVIIGIVLILRGLFFIASGWQLHKLNDDDAGNPTAPALT